MDDQIINWRRLLEKTYHTEPMPRPMGPPVCSARPECELCPYPNHGFICRSKDGTCMKTYMEKLRKEET